VAEPLAAVLVHGREQRIEELRAALVDRLDVPGVAFVLPEAPGHSWYSGRYHQPRHELEPELGRSLAAVAAAVAGTGLPPERVVLAGFSQGACLVADLVARAPAPYRGVAVLTGALIGGGAGDVTVPLPQPGTRIRCVTRRADEWVALDRVEATAAAFAAAGADVTLEVTEDDTHRIGDAGVDAVRSLLEQRA
jgi:phospholipase/carboxylesterase